MSIIFSGSKSYGIQHCLSEAISYIESCSIEAVNELNSRDVYAFAYYYDRALQANIIAGDDSGQSGQLIRVSRYYSAAKSGQ